MNLSKLFKIQKQLDERIVKEKGLEGQNLLDKKILALQVELGELANEWRGFKFWSKDQEPRTKTYKSKLSPGGEFYRGIYEANPLLEEYVDCLHFILSIGLELGIQQVLLRDIPETKDVTYQFLNLYGAIERLSECNRNHTYSEMFSVFIILGKQLGFTWEQIEQSYLEKNKINHERQANGY